MYIIQRRGGLQFIANYENATFMHACVCIRSLSLVLFACALTDCHLLLAITYALSGQTTSSPRGPVVDQSCNDLLRHFPSIWFNHLSETIDAKKFPINGTGVVIRDCWFVCLFFCPSLSDGFVLVRNSLNSWQSLRHFLRCGRMATERRRRVFSKKERRILMLYC